MRFSDLSEQEILALAISSEEEDSKIYRGFAQGLREQYPASAKVFDEMADEEVRHRTMLFDLYRSKFGDYLPMIRRQDVKGFVKRKPLWLTRSLGLDEVRKYAETMELEWTRFYHKAAQSAHDTSTMTRPRNRHMIRRYESCWTNLRMRKTNTRASPISSVKPF